MPNNNMSSSLSSNASAGKPGTITAQEFTTLEGLVSQYGPLVVSQKISKICKKMSAGYLHEFPSSVVGLAWLGLGTKIDTATGSVNRPISTTGFNFLSGLVTNYGAEVVVRKIAKIAHRTGAGPNVSASTALKALFPAPAASRAA